MLLFKDIIIWVYIIIDTYLSIYNKLKGDY